MDFRTASLTMNWKIKMNIDELIKQFVNAISKELIKAVVSSNEFKDAVSSVVEQSDTDELKTIVNDFINDDEAFTQRVKDIVEECDTENSRFENKVKSVVADMSFTTEALMW